MNNWHSANRRYLMAAIDVVRAALESYAAQVERREIEERWEVAQAAFEAVAAAMPAPSALQTLCATFGLSPFERDVLLLCVGMEWDIDFGLLCMTAQGDKSRKYATFGLALAALPDAHWAALLPTTPLRRWRLIEVAEGDGLATSPLRIDERILHYLAGMSYLDQGLAGMVEPLSSGGELAPSHQALAERVGILWAQVDDFSSAPLIQLCGAEAADREAIAGAICDLLGLELHVLWSHTIPSTPRELEALKRLWERETILSNRALLVSCEQIEPTHQKALTWLLEQTRGGIIVSSEHRLRVQRRLLMSFDVPKPHAAEQRALWQAALGPIAPSLNGQVEQLVSQFNMSAPAIQAAYTKASGQFAGQNQAADKMGELLWDSCRVQARPRLDDLAQRIEPSATWQELVLPDSQRQTLRHIAAHVRQRMKVYETWGFASKSRRGLGISALFAGASGTGKTMAAEVLANHLQLDLYHIDLSAVVSKYIGETEKNLRRIFDAAEAGGVILLFDEADALFGKRSEVKDSHDRHANIEVSYLLQRMEAYRGLAILTTNMKSALDSAFLRRIRFIVQFPFPKAKQRAEIWQQIFPAKTPTEGLNHRKLAQLNVAGGNIRNIALNAAFLAADADEPVRMSHLLRSARSEYVKLSKQLTNSEVKGWLG